MDIRLATVDDAPVIAALGMRFISRLRLGVKPVQDSVEASITALLASEHGVGLLAVEGDAIRGFLLGIAAPVWFDAFTWSAVELAWWVEPEARGGTAAVKLVREFEAWAAKRNVPRVILSDIEFVDGAMPAGALIERLGYQLIERAFAKRI